MDKTCGTCRWAKEYAACCLIIAVGMTTLVSLVSGMCWVAAEFAFWGDAPRFPWFLWRFFVIVGVMTSPFIALAVMDTEGETDNQDKEPPHAG